MGFLGETQPPALQPHGTALFIRTDFSDDRAWEALSAAVRTPSPDGFLAGIDVVDNPVYSRMSPAKLRDLLPERYRGPYFFFVADHDAVVAAGHPILVVPVPYPKESTRLNAVRRTEFRVIARQLWSVENNLSIANADWADFAGSADSDGVYRGC